MSSLIGQDDLTKLRHLLRSAGRSAALAATRADLDMSTKAGPLDPVTETDLLIETMIAQEIARLFPNDRFWGEESGMPERPHEGRVWICDPIDGTRSFLRFGHDYCICLGLLVDGRIRFAMIHDPERDDLYEAEAGRGAFLNGRTVAVKPIPDLTHALVGLGYSERVDPDAQAELVRQLLRSGAMCHQHGSGALALAQVAAGQLDAYVELHQNAWDALPGLLIAEEAGAACLRWTPEDLHNGSITLAANPAIASALARFAGGSKTPNWGVTSMSHIARNAVTPDQGEINAKEPFEEGNRQ